MICLVRPCSVTRPRKKSRGTLCLYIYIRGNLFAVDISRQIVLSSLSCYRRMCFTQSGPCPLTISSLLRHSFVFRAILSKATRLFSRERLHEISRNPNAQFSASIFSGIQSTYVSSSSFLLRVSGKCARVQVQLQTRCARVRASVSGRNRASGTRRNGRTKERTNERGKIVNSMGLMTLLGKVELRRQLFHHAETFRHPNNLGGLFVSVTIIKRHRLKTAFLSAVDAFTLITMSKFGRTRRCR